MSVKLIYSPKYDIRFLGIENLHPFDSCKYSRAWKELEQRFGEQTLKEHLIVPKKIISLSSLQEVHTKRYLDSLKNSVIVAKALEIPFLSLLPNLFLRLAILNPMLLAVAGTVIAAEQAIDKGTAINFSGGYHHANRDAGEGFCIYSDIAVSIQALRRKKKIKQTDNIVIIDLDAHQGNGLERIFLNDSYIHFFDMYNSDIYPDDDFAKQRINYDIPLKLKTKGSEYLNILKEKLPLFLDEINKLNTIKIAFYNAGTDVFENDPLGALNLSADEILERDIFVTNLLNKSKVPWVMLPSGGYTDQSYLLIANSVEQIIRVQ